MDGSREMADVEDAGMFDLEIEGAQWSNTICIQYSTVQTWAKKEAASSTLFSDTESCCQVDAVETSLSTF